MSAVAVAPTAHQRPSQPGPRTLARLLVIELRHNAMAWLVPLACLLFWLTTFRKVAAMPPLWNVRAAATQTGIVVDFAVPVTGAAAWMGCREHRRRITDALATAVV